MDSAAKSGPSRGRQARARLPLRSVAAGRGSASARDPADAFEHGGADGHAGSGGFPAFREPTRNRSTSDSSRHRDEHARLSSGELLDRRLDVLAGRDAYCRFIQGTLARSFLTHKAWTRLGFVRLSDFTRERLGITARTLEEDARIAGALEKLPHMCSAFVEGTVSWSQLRLLTRVARVHNEKEWIRKAAGVGVRELKTLVGRGAGDTGAEEEEQAVAWSVRVSREGRRLWRAAVELARRSAGEPLSAAGALEFIAAEVSGSLAAHMPGTARESSADAAVLDRLRALLGKACADGFASASDTASVNDCASSNHTASGSDGASSNESASSNDCVSANDTASGSDTASASDIASASGPARGDRPDPPRPLYDGSLEDLAIRDPQLAAFLAECAREDAELARKDAEGSGHQSAVEAAADEAAADEVADFRARIDKLRRVVADATGFGWFARSPAADAWEPLPFDPLEHCDPRELDARLREVRAAAQRLDGELAELLREAADWRIYRELGFSNLEDFMREKLSSCPATGWSLLALERDTRRSCPLLGAAWKEGRISTLAAHKILPVVGSRHGAAWIERARSVTLRRLEDEVAWTLERCDAGLCGNDSPPPEEDQDLSDTLLKTLTTADLQMRSQQVKETTPPGAVQIRVFLPVSVAILVEETLVALRRGSEPRGRVFERMLALAMLEWLSVPRHADPVFARDGWRCSVPACSSRCELHDHHLRFLSLGGGQELGNRATVCAAHHLRHIHMGRIRATGTAPHAIVWDMPFGRLLGDRYLGPREYPE